MNPGEGGAASTLRSKATAEEGLRAARRRGTGALPGSWSRRAISWPLRILLALTLLAAGCRTGPSLPAADLSAAGWQIRRGQALWQPKTDAPELAGNLLIASNPSGEDFIRFSKDPMEIVLARRNPAGWQVEIPIFGKSYSGPGQPPGRIGWFQFADALFRNSTARDWTWADLGDGRWQFANRRTGERMEGIFTP